MNKQQKRVKAIQDIAKRYGYPISEYKMLISFWELAGMLNNTWKAHLFVSRQYRNKQYDNNTRNHYAIHDFDLWRFRRMINWTRKRTVKIYLATKGYPEWYRVKIDK